MQISFSTDKNELDLVMIHQFLSEQAYWSLGIPQATVLAAIQGSLCIGMYAEAQQIGFARVITDSATFAYLCDVFVLPEFRRQGFAQQMMGYIMQHPQLQGLRRMVLVTADAHPLYRAHGFTELASPERYMEFRRLNLYRPPAQE